MRDKIVGIFVCMLLIATAVPAVISIKNSPLNTMITSSPRTCMTDDWTETQKLTASDSAAGDEFGWPVCLDGDTVLIGANGDDDNGADSGSVYVFTRSGTTWTEQQKLLASDGAAGDYFGCRIALSDDTALITALSDEESGSVYVFTRSGTTWTEQQKLTASDAAAGDAFGIGVALSGDTALIGAFQDDDKGFNSGSVYVFTRSGTTWTEQQKLLASDGAAYDDFGHSISVEDNTALIGTESSDQGTYSGSVYVFIRNDTTWTEQQKLLASDGAAGDWFGLSAISLSGDTVLIGANNDDDKGSNSGSAYVFARSGTTWTEQQKLLASDGAAEDQFSYHAVSLDGDTAFIGAFQDDDKGSNSGSAYVFTYNGTTWGEQQKLLASDGAAGDNFGWPISLDGNTVLIGANGDDDNGTNSGSAYVFTKSENQPPAPPTITGPAKGKIKVATEYNFTTTDPDGDKVSYFIDWGDGTNNSIGPYPSGDIIPQSHTWSKKGDYTIRAKAKDSHGNESGWGTLKVSMPFSYNIPFVSFWERIFERFPNVFSILQHLLGY
jgi:hypothetical protein